LSYITSNEDKLGTSAEVLKATGAINQVFRSSLGQKITTHNIYKRFTTPVLSYGSEAWIIRQGIKQKKISVTRNGYHGAHCRTPDEMKTFTKRLQTRPTFIFAQNYHTNQQQLVRRMKRTAE
jgi:hypothetical protein